MSDPGAPSGSGSGASERNRAAGDRDRAADARDVSASARDDRSAERDARAEAHDAAHGRHDGRATADRAGARDDREASAEDRQDSGDDREAAAADRVHSASEQAALLLDALTGAHMRAPGLLELQRDISRAHRTGTPFVLAFCDVDGLKLVNDSRGHLAGDDALREVARAIQGVLREYDLLLRYGGDEFVCGLLDLNLVDARERFETANDELAGGSGIQISVGLAELQPGESLADLIARADAALYEQRARLRG